ncbi:TetR family transcriptional regulator C-terminal domain-containing protein [Ferrimonas sp.]|uniref:TetR/AcrR family transcriptional regulator n=1 Tax=Ferrimonas sp. TaxID=2080861 RepID=UPI003A8CD991
MARPRRSDHNRQPLLEAGISLLSEQGYHGTGLKQILDRVKIPKGSFYHYFDSKEQFAAEVISHYIDQYLQQLKQATDLPERAPMDRLLAAIDMSLARLEQEGMTKGCMLGNLTAEIGGQSELCTQVMLQGWTLWQGWLTQQFEEAQQRKEVRQDLTAEQMARLFWDRWQGGLLHVKLKGSTEELRNDMELMLKVILR